MQQKPTDEIDLGALFSKIGSFFRSLGTGLIKLLALVRNVPINNKRLFIFLIMIGGLAGYAYSGFIKKKFYESSMILSSEYLNKRIVDNAVGKLNLLALEESPSGLASVLHVSDSIADNIVKFESKPFVAEKELIELEVLKEQLKSAQLKN